MPGKKKNGRGRGKEKTDQYLQHAMARRNMKKLRKHGRRKWITWRSQTVYPSLPKSFARPSQRCLHPASPLWKSLLRKAYLGPEWERRPSFITALNTLLKLFPPCLSPPLDYKFLDKKWGRGGWWREQQLLALYLLNVRHDTKQLLTCISLKPQKTAKGIY